MLLETVTTSFSKALQNGNSGQATFQTITTLAGISQNPKAVYGDGVVELDGFGIMGQSSGLYTQNRLQLIPYGDGSTGSTFNFRIYGWDFVLAPNPNLGTWVPFLLAEYTCTTSAISGTAGYALSATENLCDFIKLVNGTTGTNGFGGGLVSSASATGTNLIAFVLQALSACRYVQFDFQKSSSVNMNCLWSRA